MNVPWPKDRRGADAETHSHPGVLTGPGLGGNHTLEAKRRELRDSETFSSRGEMFTNMSLWREERGVQTPALVAVWSLDQVSTVSPFPPDPIITVPTPPLPPAPFTHILALPPREFCSR